MYESESRSIFICPYRKCRRRASNKSFIKLFLCDELETNISNNINGSEFKTNKKLNIFYMFVKIASSYTKQMTYCYIIVK